MGCCDEDLVLPVGDQGPIGQSAYPRIDSTIAGVPFATSSTSYVSVGRLIFSNVIEDPFTAIKNNVYVSAGTGSLRIKDLITGNVLYENAAITSNSSINIETATGQSFVPSASAILSIEVKHNTGGAATISIATSLFYRT